MSEKGSTVQIKQKASQLAQQNPWVSVMQSVHGNQGSEVQDPIAQPSDTMKMDTAMSDHCLAALPTQMAPQQPQQNPWHTPTTSQLIQGCTHDSEVTVQTAQLPWKTETDLSMTHQDTMQQGSQETTPVSSWVTSSQAPPDQQSQESPKGMPSVVRPPIEQGKRWVTPVAVGSDVNPWITPSVQLGSQEAVKGKASEDVSNPWTTKSVHAMAQVPSTTVPEGSPSTVKLESRPPTEQPSTMTSNEPVSTWTMHQSQPDDASDQISRLGSQMQGATPGAHPWMTPTNPTEQGQASLITDMAAVSIQLPLSDIQSQVLIEGADVRWKDHPGVLPTSEGKQDDSTRGTGNDVTALKLPAASQPTQGNPWIDTPLFPPSSGPGLPQVHAPLHPMTDRTVWNTAPTGSPWCVRDQSLETGSPIEAPSFNSKQHIDTIPGEKFITSSSKLPSSVDSTPTSSTKKLKPPPGFESRIRSGSFGTRHESSSKLDGKSPMEGVETFEDDDTAPLNFS